MIPYDSALKMLKEKCPENVVKHCLAVSQKSHELAMAIKKNGHEVNIELCKIGGLLHDIGRSVSHGLSHGILGSEILKDYPELSNIAKRHVGAGIPKNEAIELGISKEDLIPLTVEEKIVCYADKLVHGDRIVDDASEEIEKLEKKLGKKHGAIERIRGLEHEINSLIGKI